MLQFYKSYNFITQIIYQNKKEVKVFSALNLYLYEQKIY